MLSFLARRLLLAELLVPVLLGVPLGVVAALAGSSRARRLAFPAVMLLTVLDVVLLLTGGAGVA